MKKYNFLKKIIFLFLLFAFCPNALAQSNRIVARVNNEIITQGDLANYQVMLSIRDSHDLTGRIEDEKEEALSRLIEDRLILLKAKAEDIEVSRDWLDSRIAQLASAYPDFDTFSESLREQGISLSYLRRRFEEQFLMQEIINRKVRAQVSILPGQISQYYKKNMIDFEAPRQVSFLIARSQNEDDLKKISNTLSSQGLDRAKALFDQELSEMCLYLDKLQEPLAEALAELDDGSHKILAIGNTYYLVYRKEMDSPRLLSLSEAQEEVYRRLWQEEFSRKFRQWVDSLKEGAVIETFL